MNEAKQIAEHADIIIEKVIPAWEQTDGNTVADGLSSARYFIGNGTTLEDYVQTLIDSDESYADSADTETLRLLLWSAAKAFCPETLEVRNGFLLPNFNSDADMQKALQICGEIGNAYDFITRNSSTFGDHLTELEDKYGENDQDVKRVSEYLVASGNYALLAIQPTGTFSEYKSQIEEYKSKMQELEGLLLE